MSEAAQYIFTDAENVLGENITHLVCYFHLKQALKRSFAKHNVEKSDRIVILKHVDNM